MTEPIRPVRWQIAQSPTNCGFILEIEDEGAGEFVSIEEAHSGDKIRVEPEEWLHLRRAIDLATALIASREAEQNKTEG